jgi:hypothetical protein
VLNISSVTGEPLADRATLQQQLKTAFPTVTVTATTVGGKRALRANADRSVVGADSRPQTVRLVEYFVASTKRSTLILAFSSRPDAGASKTVDTIVTSLRITH